MKEDLRITEVNFWTKFSQDRFKWKEVFDHGQTFK